MVKVIMGVKGTGKTKQMIELMNKAVETEHGNVVAIERGPKLTFDLSYKIRLIDAADYDLTTFAHLKGFIGGIYASNFDITHVFIDNFFKMLDDSSNEAIEELLAWLDDFSEKENVKFTISASAEVSGLTENITKYF